MKNERSLEELESMRRIVIQSKEMPEDITRIVKKIFTDLSEKYSELRCNNSAIESYLESTLNSYLAQLNKIGNSRKDALMQEFLDMERAIEKDLEDELDVETIKRKDNVYRGIISELGKFHNRRNTDTIMDTLQTALKDIQSHQNRLLGARGYNSKQIEDINDEIKSFIRYKITKNEEVIYELMQGDTKALNNRLLRQYEEYIRQRDSEEHKSKVENNRGAFIESLKDKRTLEEQRKDAQEITFRLDEEVIDGQNKKRNADLFI